MRYLEWRRHSKRVRPNEHLSQEGVDLARRLGEELGPFDLIISSRVQRAMETAVAMGFAIADTYEHVQFSQDEWAALDRLLSEGTPFSERARVMAESPLASRYAEALRRQAAALAEALPEGGVALVISHGGYMDDLAVACLPEASHVSWGPNFGHCEGIRLAYDQGRFVGGELLRAI